MSRIPEIKKSLKLNMKDTLSKLIPEYDAELLDAKDRLSVKGKTVEQANKEQAGWLSHYDQKRAEVEAVYHFLDEWAEKKTRGKLFKDIITNNPRDLSDRAINQIIDGTDEYLNARELVLEIKELLEKCKAVVDAFRQRGFSLRNITELRVNRIHDEIL